MPALPADDDRRHVLAPDGWAPPRGYVNGVVAVETDVVRDHGRPIPFGRDAPCGYRAPRVLAVFDLPLGLLMTGSLFALVLAFSIRFLAVSLGAVEAGMERADIGLRTARRPVAARRFQVRRLAVVFFAHLPQQVEHRGHIAKMRHVLDHERLGGEQRRAHDGKRGVFRAGDGDFAFEPDTAFDHELVHVRLSSLAIPRA